MNYRVGYRVGNNLGEVFVRVFLKENIIQMFEGRVQKEGKIKGKGGRWNGFFFYQGLILRRLNIQIGLENLENIGVGVIFVWGI